MPPPKLIIVDTAMDLATLAAVQLCFGRIHFRRLLAGLGILQLSSLLYILFGDIARNPLISALAGIAASRVLTPARGLKQLFRRTACLFIITSAAAGMMAASGNGFTASAVITALLSVPLLIRRRMHINYRWNIEAVIECGGRQICFDALIDTGNRLREPISGLPVMIVSASLFPDGPGGGKGMRKLSFSVLGSCGEINAFRTNAVRIRNSGSLFRTAPECYIALFPGNIPGGLQALAPPEFTEVLEPINPNIQRRLSRRRKKTCHFQASDNPFTVS